MICLEFTSETKPLMFLSWAERDFCYATLNRAKDLIKVTICLKTQCKFRINRIELFIIFILSSYIASKKLQEHNTYIHIVR